MDLKGLPTLAETINRLDLRARKSLGQNFLLDPRILAKLADIAIQGPEDTPFLEIGPGPGGLSRALLEKGKTLCVIEKDKRFAPVLELLKHVAGSKFSYHIADALEFDFDSLYPGQRYKIAANLPYNVATPLLIHWLNDLTNIAGIYVMLQKEVALRILARPRTKEYGRLSIICQSCCEVKKEADLQSGSFTPPPKVTSSFVSLVPKKDRPPPALLNTIEMLSAKTFQMRRKMLRKSLQGLSVNADELLACAETDPTLRAEDLSVQDYHKLAASYRSLLTA